MSNLPQEPAASRTANGLKGEVSVPGDKSMSHRSLMLGTLAVGETPIRGLLTGEDVMATAEAMRRLGAVIERDGDDFQVSGVGVGGLREPMLPLDMGNSGTSTRLILGLLATHDLTAVVFGDASLNKRPMARVTDPLSQFGARFMARSGGRLPLAVQGTADAVPVRYVSPVASAQVKSAVLLAGLNAPGETTLVETTPTRDHTERMLRGFGAIVNSEATDDGLAITLVGQPELRATPVMVPGDPSSAAFLAVAGTIVPGSALTIANVMQNDHRTGLFQSLRDMGADLALLNSRKVAGETVADVRVASSSLKGCLIPADRAPSQIDEYPILSVAAAVASGTTRMEGLEELRVKESDRLAGIIDMLSAAGVVTRSGEDWLEIEGLGGPVPGGGLVETQLDHRRAMSTLILGMVSEQGMRVDDRNCILTSFPTFVSLFNQLGADIA
ncbi:MAG: 3-phosphoshikimate 1-carboxyvinyltransferase [Rhodospirillaceae bacterium]|nr:MAG: 3-phosphoshikimate 1-carboxyvinyltransferase [Rhodospirillaceae bacterium]